MAKQKTIWMRVGVNLKPTADEVEKLLIQDEESNNILKTILKEGRFEFEGESYIPCYSIDEYNEECGTNHEPKNYDLYL